jgi:vitamin B12 transporter
MPCFFNVFSIVVVVSPNASGESSPAGMPAGELFIGLLLMTSTVFRHARTACKPVAMAVAICAAFPYSAFAQAKALEPVVVTATRAPQIAKDVLSDNIVITSEDIARSGHTSLADLLQGRRGIEIARNGGRGTNSSVYIRGTENRQNVVLIDGVRVGSATSGGATWANIPLSQVDRVEIVYGPLSSLYGADAVGGVVQIFTRKGSGPAAPTVSAGVGSYDRRNVEAGVSGSQSGFRYALSAAHERSDEFSATKPGAFGFNPDKDGYKSDSASGQFGFELAKGHELGLNFLRSRLESQYDASRNFDDRIISNLQTYAVSSRNRFLPNWSSQLQVGQSKDKTNSISVFPSRFDTTQTHVTWQNDVTVNTTDLLQMVLERRDEQVDSTTTALNRKRTTDSVAAAYQLKRGAHLASLSLRNDDSSQFGAYTTGNVAYGYRITGALRANASYGTSLRAPTFNELYFPGFGIPTNRPEKGKNAEIGLYYDDGTSQLTAVAFHNRITDLIVSTLPCPVTPENFAFGCAYNVNKALLAGVSLGAAQKLGNFTLNGSLDFQDPKDETTGRRLARRAKRHGTIGADYRAGATQAGAEIVFAGKRFDDPSNRNLLGGYGLLNLHASYDFARNWTLFGRWDNVLGKDYELARNYATAGSSVFVGVRYGLK